MEDFSETQPSTSAKHYYSGPTINTTPKNLGNDRNSSSVSFKTNIIDSIPTSVTSKRMRRGNAEFWRWRKGSLIQIVMLFMYAVVLNLVVAGEEQSRMDRILKNLMVESLRNNLVQACDNEKITLHCPRNTHILLQNAFYGRLVPSRELCPPGGSLISTSTSSQEATDSTSTTPSTDNSTKSSSLEEGLWRRGGPGSGSGNSRYPYEDTSCDFSEAHNRITELCRSKRKCKIVVKPATFGDRDPCPTTSKYLQISYKCKPISFEDQTFCQGTNMQLNCKANKRLSIYSAQYGRTVNGQAMHCSSSSTSDSDLASLNQDCVRDVLPEILKACHAQTDCSIGVNDHFLGNPCGRGVQKYLSLIYMCVNDEVFSEAALKGAMDSMNELEQELEIKRKQAPPAPPEQGPSDQEQVHHQRRHHSTDQLHSSSSTSEVHKSTLEHEIASDYGVEHASGNGRGSDELKKSSVVGEERDDGRQRPEEAGELLPNAVEVADDFVSFLEFVKTNKEKCLLYFFLSASTGIILLLLACITLQCRARSKEKKQANLLAGRNHQTVSVCRSALPHVRSGAELSSLIDSSNHTSPLYLDSDDSRNNGLAEYCGVLASSHHRLYDKGAPMTPHPIYSSSGSSTRSGHTVDPRHYPQHTATINTGRSGPVGVLTPTLSSQGTTRSSGGGTNRTLANINAFYNMDGGMGMTAGNGYARYSQATPPRVPRIPPTLHYYS